MRAITTYENREPLDGWHVQPGKHCGVMCVDLACPVCGEWVNVPTNIQLAEN